MAGEVGGRWISSGSASDLLGVSESTIRRLADGGEIKSYRIQPFNIPRTSCIVSRFHSFSKNNGRHSACPARCQKGALLLHYYC